LSTTYVNSKPAFKKGSEPFSYVEDYDDDDDNDNDDDDDDDNNNNNNKWVVEKKTETCSRVFRIFVPQSGGNELKSWLVNVSSYRGFLRSPPLIQKCRERIYEMR
jgi:hypothetical protein